MSLSDLYPALHKRIRLWEKPCGILFFEYVGSLLFFAASAVIAQLQILSLFSVPKLLGQVSVKVEIDMRGRRTKCLSFSSFYHVRYLELQFRWHRALFLDLPPRNCCFLLTVWEGKGLQSSAQFLLYACCSHGMLPLAESGSYFFSFWAWSIKLKCFPHS